MTSVSGPSLVFDSVSRAHVASYLCIASNGVPPSVSKRVDLRVQCEYEYLLKKTKCFRLCLSDDLRLKERKMKN